MGSLFPEYSKCERIADAFIHVTGISPSVGIAVVLLVVAVFHLPALHVVALGITTSAPGR